MAAVSKPRRRIRLWLAIIIMVVAALWLLRGPLLGPFVAHHLARTLTNALGGPVEIGRAGGGWLHDAHVEAVTSCGKLSGPLRSLAVDHLAIHYALGLLRGDLTSLSQIEAHGVRVDLASQSGGAATGTWAPILEWLPDPLPMMDVGGSLSMQLGHARLDIPGVALIGGGRRAVLAIHGATMFDLPPQDFSAVLERRDRATLVLAEPVVVSGVNIKQLELIFGTAMQRVTLGAIAWGGSLDVIATPTTLTATIHDLDLAALPEYATAMVDTLARPIAGRLDAIVTAKRDVQAPSGWAVAATFTVSGGSVAGRSVQALHGTATLTDDGVRISELSIDVDGGIHVQVEDLEVVHLGRFWLPRRGRINVVIDDLRPWLAQFGTPAQWLPAQPVALTTSIVIATGTVICERLHIVTSGLTIDGAGSVAPLIRRIGSSELTIHADLDKLARQVPALVGAQGILDGRAHYAGHFPTTVSALLDGDATLTFSGTDVGWRDVHAPRLAMIAQSDHGALVVSAGELESMGVSLQFSGRATPRAANWDINFERVAVDWRGLFLRTAAPLAVRIGAQGWSCGPLMAVVPGGTLNASVAMADTWKIAATLENLDMAALGAAFGRKDLSGLLTTALTIEGNPLRPVVQTSVATKDLMIAGHAGTISLALNQGDDGIHIRECSVDLGANLQAAGSGSWPAIIGKGGVIPIDDHIPELALDVASDDLSTFAGRWVTGGSAKLSLHCRDGVAVVGNLAVRELRLRQADTARPGRRVRAPLPLDADIDLRLDEHGGHAGFSATLGSWPVLSGELNSPGAITSLDLPQRHLDGRVQVKDLPIEGLLGVIPGLLQGSGWISGTATVGGTATAPDINADLALTAGEFKLASDMPTITGVAGSVTLHHGQLKLNGVSAELGLSPAHLGGTVDLNGDAPIFALDLNGDNLLLSQNRDLYLRANTNLHLIGPLRALVLSGEIDITNALYSRRVDLIGGKSRSERPTEDQVQLFAIRDPPLADMRFNVQVRTSTQRRDQGLRIANNLLRASATVDLHLGGTGALPQPEGLVKAREARVTLPFSTLTVEHAEVIFPNDDPFAPTIAATGHAQIRQYAVTVNVQGLVRNPEIHAASPGLEERDALLLLTTGSTTAELEDPNGQRAAIGRVGTWLGRETWRLLSGPGNPEGKDNPLDRLTIEIGRAVSDTGRETIEAEYPLTKPDTLPGMYLYGERDRYDDYNMGFIMRLRWGGSR